MRRRAPIEVLLLLVILLISAQAAFGQTTPAVNTRGKNALKNLGPFKLIVENYSTVPSDSVAMSRLREDVERRLKRAGLMVLKEKGVLRGAPTLYLKLVVSKSATAYTFLIDMQLREEVHPLRRPLMKLTAATWQNSAIGSFESINPQVTFHIISEGVGSMIDLFVRDYVAVSQKSVMKVKYKMPFYYEAGTSS